MQEGRIRLALQILGLNWRFDGHNPAKAAEPIDDCQKLRVTGGTEKMKTLHLWSIVHWQSTAAIATWTAASKLLAG